MHPSYNAVSLPLTLPLTTSLATMTYRYKDAESGEPCHKKRRLNYDTPLSEAIKVLMQGGPPRIQPWKQILKELETIPSQLYTDDCEWIQSLYSTLLLHLGYILSLSRQAQDLLLVLCQCWHRMLDLTTVPPFNRHDQHQQQDAVGLLSQILDEHQDNAGIAIMCLEVASHCILSGSVGKDTSSEKRLLFSIVRLVANQTIGTISAKALSVLEMAATTLDTSRYARILCVAAHIIQTCEDGTQVHQDSIMRKQESDIDTSFYKLGLAVIRKYDGGTLKEQLDAFQERKDVLLFLRGLALSPKVAVHLAHSEHTIEILYSMSKGNNNMSDEAACCLSCIARNGGHSKLLIDKLIARLLSGGSNIAKQASVAGLYTVLQHHYCTAPEKQIGSIISSLSDLIRNEGSSFKAVDDKRWFVDVANLLSFMATHLAKGGEWTIYLEQSLQSLTCLLEGELEETGVDVALDCTLEISSNKNLIRHMTRMHHFLTSIARVVINDFTPTATKYKAIQILWNITQDKANLPIMARTPKVLDALIAVASTANQHAIEAMNNVASKARQLALETLLKLSELVSNRRILAKQVGLLSCLIRFTRRMTPNDSLLLLPKEKLKDRILEIAILL